MSISHRQDDSRVCGATTTVIGQDFVTINGKLWAVNDDTNTDGNGQLITTHAWLTIAGKGIIVVGDHAKPDNVCPIPPHCDPIASAGDGLVTVS